MAHQRQPKKGKRKGPSSYERGYGGKTWSDSRQKVLRRDRFCKCQSSFCHLEVDGRCAAPARVADHYPLSRKQLLAMGDLNPDDPTHMRGLCTRCHNKETARLQPSSGQFKGKT
jgi:5-methylcytosine-specific restriction protein A